MPKHQKPRLDSDRIGSAAPIRRKQPPRPETIQEGPRYQLLMIPPGTTTPKCLCVVKDLNEAKVFL